jgi:hypothetical protein
MIVALLNFNLGTNTSSSLVRYWDLPDVELDEEV